MSKYSTISARLEVELLTSQQRLREAFSNEDLKSAKQMKEELEKFQEVCGAKCLLAIDLHVMIVV